jgi:hypothetical protein
VRSYIGSSFAVHWGPMPEPIEVQGNGKTGGTNA